MSPDTPPEKRMSIDEIRAAEEAAREPGDGMRVVGRPLYVMSALSVLIGLINTYGDFRVVGGDAYNLLIYSVRGVMFVLIGLVFAVAGMTALIIAAMLRSSSSRVK
jgi:hypothetical protein